MSKKLFKSQASSSRAVSGAFGVLDGTPGGTFGIPSAFASATSSPLSYVYEPIDLSRISEPNMIVTFKNLQKKDSTTKAKALEDLQAYVNSLEGGKIQIEDVVLEIWIKLYPRTSLDNSRRVRQLSHVLQGQISVSSGKRIAKHLPKIIGSWLAGLFDSDRSVTRAAHDSFAKVLNSEEKLKGIWKIYQNSILEYSRDALSKETVQTLSDERTMSPDDALAKYTRLLSTAMSMVTHALDNLTPTDLDKQQTLYQEILGSEKIWSFASGKDATIRRASYRLLAAALIKRKEALDMATISRHVLVLSLHINQTGSIFEYVKTLCVLTSTEPAVWTQHYTGSGKKSATKRLCQFLTRGSQNGPFEFWPQLLALLRTIPAPVLIPEVEQNQSKELDEPCEGAYPIIEAFRNGINSRDEPRFNQDKAWDAYTGAVEVIESLLSNAREISLLMKVSLAPLLRQYIKPSLEDSDWTLPSTRGLDICVGVSFRLLQSAPEVFQDQWRQISAVITEDIQTSLPEQAKDYTRSQNAVASQCERLYSLQAAVSASTKSVTILPFFEKTLQSELEAAVKILKARNGKPYGAAAAIEYAMKFLPNRCLDKGSMEMVVVDFAQNEIPKLLSSPSASRLISVLNALSRVRDMRGAYENTMVALIEIPDSEGKFVALQCLVASPCLGLAPKVKALDSLVKQSLQDAMNGNESQWVIVQAAISNPTAPASLTNELLATMTEGLLTRHRQLAGLRGLSITLEYHPQAVKTFSTSQVGLKMLSNTILLADSPDETIAQKAKDLSTQIEAIYKEGDVDTAMKSLTDIVRKGLDSVDRTSLSIESLVQQAQKILRQASEDDIKATAANLLPENLQWTRTLAPFFTRRPNPSLAMLNTIGNSVHMINAPLANIVGETVTQDTDGFSSAVRMSWYTTKLIKATCIMDLVDPEQQIEICKNLALVIQLANDDLSISGAGQLWQQDDAEVEGEIIDFVTEVQGLLAVWLRDPRSSSLGLVTKLLDQLLETSHGMTILAYYSGRVYSTLATEVTELLGSSHVSIDMERARDLRNSPDIFTSAAIVTASTESKGLFRLSNELLADLTEYAFYEKTDEGLRKLILLNIIIQRQEEYATEIPQQRLVFFVKHATTQLQQNKGSASSSITAEILKSLIVLLPKVKSIYGSFWADIIQAASQLLRCSYTETDNDLPQLHASLRLLSKIAALAFLDSNDDLLDAWTEISQSTNSALLKLVIQLSDVPDENHQPRRIINELLLRRMAGYKLPGEDDATELYSVLASQSSALQQVAYDIFHYRIPEQQEEVSIDKALSKSNAKLPEELLSLILEASTVESLADSNFERSIPLPLQSYLLSWKLIFDHWTNASYQVKEDYAESLKEGTYLKGLLDFAVNFLITTRSRPVDASKFDIKTYTPNTQESPEKEVQWLLIHLYYLCLQYLPTPSKAWWLDNPSRATVIAVESWTEKYISPLIITAALHSVSTWLPTQDSTDTITTLTVKLSPSARELTASLPIDDRTLALAIRLPPTYPLAPCLVESVSRIGIDEKKWRSWLINTQGIINFSSSGSLVDGLVAFKRNVGGMMKGQSECAICYSVVGADKTLPGKRCGTCRNCFHGGCLFRWFKSSNSSSCPLCRNAFNYG